MSIDELFRVRLENAEVVPSQSVNEQLMRKLSRREFWRFNPARFNIYYLGIIAASVITAGILLFSSKEIDEKKEQDVSSPESSLGVISIQAGEAVITNPGPGSVSVKGNTVEINPLIDTMLNEDVTLARENNFVRPAVPITPVKSEAVVRGAVAKDDNLQGISSERNILFVPSVLFGCAPLKVSFNCLNTSFDSYNWSFGRDGYSREKNPEWIFEKEGEYQVLLNARSGERNLVYSEIIKVYSRPNAGFTISPDNPVIPDEEISFVNYSTNAVSFRWNFGDGNTSSEFEPKHRYSNNGDFKVSLVAYSENGCVDSAVLSNAFKGSDHFIEMPNAFIPNPQGPSGGFYSNKSDESGEVFHPHYSGIVDYELNIYSKLGILVFESNDINIGWDGYFKGQLSNPGVYIWKITGSFRNGETFTKMGDVTLLKR